MNKIFLPVFILLSISLTAEAQQVRPATSSQIYHELHQLNNLTSVLYVAAHPDDENTRMLTWLVNDRHIRTAYLSLTRGDGGQNILGPHLGPSLGLIRTHELLEARKLDGAEQFFTRAIDFGYSKTAEETFNHWNKDSLTHDVVWVMRKYRPDVVICRFPPNEQAGHGQHAASAILAAEAYKVVADPKAYPQQLEQVELWKPKRILFNSYRFGSRNTTSEEHNKIDVGQYNPLLGMGYGELAGISRSIHRSQGAGTRSVPGVQTEYFALVDGQPFTSSLFEGIDTTWGRVNRKDIGNKIATIIKDYNFNKPDAILPQLLQLRKEIKGLKDIFWRARKLQEVDDIILHCAGFMAELYTNTPETIQGATLPFTLNIIARSSTTVNLISASFPNGDSTINSKLSNDELISYTRNITIPQDAPYTEPYWLSSTGRMTDHYPAPVYKQMGLPKTINPLTATLKIKIDKEEFEVLVPLSYKTLDATHGDVVEQLRVVPYITLDFVSDLLATNTDGTLDAKIHIHAAKEIKNGDLVIYNRAVQKISGPFNLAAGKDTTINVKLSAEEVAQMPEGDFYLNAGVTAATLHYNKTQHTIKYEHLPTLQFYSQPQVKVLRKNWACKAKRIGYIEGAGDNVSEILRFAGLEVDILKPSDITVNNLKNYDAVMVGIRAINVKEEAPLWMPELLRYANEGGTVVMQYNTAHRLNTKEIGPYPITLSYNRVTEEDAKVTILDKNHKLLNYPNKITEVDFDNWVQERGLYFASEWDNHYTPLFSMNDTGEEPQKGSTLYTSYGKGHYIYTPISFFRQLPAGNKGAMRLLLNFLSIGN
ncbi:MAG: PIG-L family deacetylase [Flavipsychrobacter sp.]